MPRNKTEGQGRPDGFKIIEGLFYWANSHGHIASYLMLCHETKLRDKVGLMVLRSPRAYPIGQTVTVI